ncbi:hypothetical protein [Herbiconiux solani]|uniref:hypothetical protein n=1 Tax=Herbiconiux solani TaxID=661329 RepID=UPI000824F317|nr:hypothetical protein [Herbiconiux solani]
MSLPSDPDQSGIEFAGVETDPVPDGAILEEAIPNDADAIEPGPSEDEGGEDDPGEGARRPGTGAPV